MADFWIIVSAIWMAGSVVAYFSLRLLISRVDKRWKLSDRYIAIAFSLIGSWLIAAIALGMTPFEFVDRDAKW